MPSVTSQIEKKNDCEYFFKEEIRDEFPKMHGKLKIWQLQIAFST